MPNSIIRRTLLATALLGALPASRAENSVIVANVPGYPGTTVSVPVILRQTTAATVSAAQFDVAFNSSKVAPQAARLDPRLASHVIRSRQIAPGVERVLIYSLNNSAVPGTNGAVADIPFQVSSTELISSGPLAPGNVTLARADGTTVSPVTNRVGTIFVRKVNPLPDGGVQFFLPSTPDARYVVEASTNLVQWSAILTNTATSTFLDLLDPNPAEAPYRFYRSRTDP